MNKLFAVLLFVCILIIAALLILLLNYRRQINYLNEQLHFLRDAQTNLKLVQGIPFESIRRLSLNINEVLEKQQEIYQQMRNSNRHIKEVITSISHDLRTPLTSANGYIQMLSDKRTDEAKRYEYVGIIEERIDEVRRLLDQLFEYVRIEADELALEDERVNVNNLLMDAVALYYNDYVNRGTEPVIEISDIPMFIQGDKGALKRCFSNVINNGLTHGGGGYWIRLMKEENWAVLKFSNHTESISEEDMEFIFERFYTSDQSRSRKTTGLGLSITKSLVERMGGNIAAELNEGRFIIQMEFPLK